jgi:hypothetical protein
MRVNILFRFVALGEGDTTLIKNTPREKKDASFDGVDLLRAVGVPQHDTLLLNRCGHAGDNRPVTWSATWFKAHF